jgi:hypothetical protein
MKKQAITSLITLIALVAASNASAATTRDVRDTREVKESVADRKGRELVARLKARGIESRELRLEPKSFENISKMIEVLEKAEKTREPRFLRDQKQAIQEVLNSLSASAAKVSETRESDAGQIFGQNKGSRNLLESRQVISGLAGEMSRLEKADSKELEKYTKLAGDISGAIERNSVDPLRDATKELLKREGVSDPTEAQINARLEALKERKDKNC